ncbi:hypothetical protein GOQ04_08610 [Emticicia sp. ODNR4P]|nr:hypothetical protein [Emticicia sp. ODNR4P]
MKTVYHCFVLDEASITPEQKINIKGKFLKSEGKWNPDVSVQSSFLPIFEFENCLFLKKIKQRELEKGDKSDFVAFEIERDNILLFSQDTMYLDLINNLTGIEKFLEGLNIISMPTQLNYQSENFSNYLKYGK